MGSFVMVSTGTLTGALLAGCGGSSSSSSPPAPSPYLIDPVVKTTAERMISFRYDLTDLAPNELDEVSKYDEFGYGDWTYVEPGLPVEPRNDLMRQPYTYPTHTNKLLNFFTFSDIHITDKEAPNQLIFLQEYERFAVNNTSIYSPVMMYTTHVLDAAMQTMNALHKKNPFDFGLSLGDTCNSTSYNELRWYMDVIDGQVIRPSSGAHLGEDTIDYQRPYQAVGLDKSIPWYQVLGNHDHFMIGSFPVDAVPSRGLRESYVADTVWAVGDVLIPQVESFPVMIDVNTLEKPPLFYMGVIDGTTPLGKIIHAGVSTDTAFAQGAPKVVADPNRRSLMRTEWIEEFFKTDSNPVGHGFNLVDKSAPAGFACYSFVPKADVPLKIIVLDDTQSENDGSDDIHGHGFLDAYRWDWLKAELAAGQAANQLMVIAAHAPIAVGAIGSELEWWLNDTRITPTPLVEPWWDKSNSPVAPEYQNATDLTGLVTELQNNPNLIMWISGHRHFNTVKAFKSPDIDNAPEKGFWQVETSSLRDFPQQLRTFEIYLNSDYTVSVVVTNVDPAVAPGTPAATSRRYAVAVQQIVKNDLQASSPNPATMNTVPLPTVDPTRPQAGDASISNDPALAPDPTIRYNAVPGVPYTGSYNAELYKPLSPAMVAALKARFPA